MLRIPSVVSVLIQNSNYGDHPKIQSIVATTSNKKPSRHVVKMRAQDDKKSRTVRASANYWYLSLYLPFPPFSWVVAVLLVNQMLGYFQTMTSGRSGASRLGNPTARVAVTFTGVKVMMLIPVFANFPMSVSDTESGSMREFSLKLCRNNVMISIPSHSHDFIFISAHFHNQT